MITRLFLAFSSIIIWGFSLKAQPALIDVDENPFPDNIYGGSNNGIVGAIQGNINVLPTGNITYTMPLDLPIGCGGMTPQLSISYNSYYNDGFLGWGFELEGLSTISRAYGTIVTDGSPSKISLINNNRYSLDGNRMKSYGNGTYGLEIGSIAKIVPDVNNNPQMFTVYNGDGTVSEYGGTTDSRVYGQGQDSENVLFWLVSKVTDSNGNYYTVSYVQNNSGEYYPSRIEYSGNSVVGVDCKLSVNFEYAIRNVTNITYIGHTRLCLKHLLKRIEIMNGNKVVKSYRLGYDNEFVPHLISVTETGSDGITKYNPTTFSWYKTQTETPEVCNISSDKYLSNAYVYPGDFNGDGRMDILATPKNDKEWTGWKLFLSIGSGFYTEANKGDLLPGHLGFIVGDFNADGKSDFIEVRSVNNPYTNYFLFISDGRNFIRRQEAITTETKPTDAVAGDFNGDGACDLLIYYLGSKDYKQINSNYVHGLEVLSYTTPIYYANNNWGEVCTGDFNGDGMTDVMNVHSEGFDIMNGASFGVVAQSYSGGRPKLNHHYYLGDFNGDGNTDILMTGYQNYEWDHFQIQLSTAYGFEQNNTPHYFNSNDKSIFVADINGDGKDDFFAIDRKGQSATPVLCYINDGNGLSYTKKTGKDVYSLESFEYFIGDTNGDGKNDLWGHSVNLSQSYTGYRTLCYSPDNWDGLLKKITDGMCNDIEIKYSYAYPNDNTETDVQYPLRKMNVIRPLVSHTSHSDGMGGKIDVAYSFDNGYFHVQGRGFLGYKDFKVNNLTTGDHTEYKYGIYAPIYQMGLEYNNSYRGVRLYSETSTLNVLKTIKNKTTLLLPIEITETKYGYLSREKYLVKREQSSYDDWGNPVRNVVIFNDKDSTLTTTEYLNDFENVKLGVPLKMQTSYARGDKPKETITEEYTYYDDTYNIKNKKKYATSFNYPTETYTYDAFGNVLTFTLIVNNGLPRVTKYSYSPDGRLKISETDAEGYVKSFAYDAYTDAITLRHENGVDTYIECDAFGNPIKEFTEFNSKINSVRWCNGVANAPKNAVYLVQKDETGHSPVIEFYDSKGRLLRTKSPVFRSRHALSDIEYDSQGRIIKQSSPYLIGENIKWETLKYNHYGDVVEKSYNYQPSVKYEHDQTKAGEIIVKEIDKLGRFSVRLKNIHDELITTVDPMSNATKFSYDYMGNCNLIEAQGKTVVMKNDISGNRTFLNDPDLGAYFFVYDEYGQLLRQQNVKTEDRIDYVYDRIGRVVSRADSDGLTEYTYSSVNPEAIKQIFNKKTGMGRAWQYDDYGRVTEEYYIIDRREYIFRYRYDAFNRLNKLIYPSGFELIYSYDPYGHLCRMTDKNGSTIWALYDENASHIPTSYALGSKIFTKVSYNDYGLLSEIDYKDKLTFKYEFDPERNLRARHTVQLNCTEFFKYDDLKRLMDYSVNYRLNKVESSVQSLSDDVSSDFLDEFWNKTVETVRKDYTDDSVEKDASKESQLLNEMNYDKAGNILNKAYFGSLTYETGSNRLSEIDARYGPLPVPWDIEYTGYDKVSRVSNNLVSYDIAYGVDHQRAKSVLTTSDGSRVTHYAGKLFELVREDGKTYDKSYIYANDRPVAVICNDTIEFLLTDYLSSVSAVSDKDGEVTEINQYDAWGRKFKTGSYFNYLKPRKGDPVHTRGYCGHEELPLLGLIDMNGRMYDPCVGRFISPDPYVQAPELSQNFNRYSYCLNNPLSYKDETGEFFLFDDFIIGFFKGLIGGKAPFKSGAKQFVNSARIWWGLFTTDENKNFWQKSWEVLSRFSWQSPQMALGLVTSHSYNTFGQVQNVHHLYGATVLTSKSISGKRAVTLGSFIVGNRQTVADPNNTTFQHEYGHYLQSQEMGLGYMFGVGIPSFVSAIKEDNHKFKSFERDANWKAFVYFNKHLGDAFYTSPEDWDAIKNHLTPHSSGWNFWGNPLVKEGTSHDHYVDYKKINGLNITH